MRANAAVSRSYTLDDCQQIRRLLRRGGRQTLCNWHRGATLYTPERYHAARIEAARRVIARQIRDTDVTSWRHVRDVRLALGKIDPDTAATGGRGLLAYAEPDGDWTGRCIEVEDWLNVPL